MIRASTGNAVIEIAAPTKSTNASPVDRDAVDDVMASVEPEGDSEAGEERHPEHRSRHEREVPRPRQVRAVELRADRERERDEADRPEVAHDAHRVLAQEPCREVVRARAEHRRPDHDSGQELTDHRGLAEPAADDAAEMGGGADDRDREQRAEDGRHRQETRALM